MASEAFSEDGSIRDYPDGMFRAAHENEAVPVQVWHVSGGALKVQVLENVPNNSL